VWAARLTGIHAGFFIGPFYPVGLYVITTILPQELHLGAIGASIKHQNTIVSHPTNTALGFTASFGSIGCAIFPFLTGAIASRAGVEALQPIMIALLVGMTIFWAFVPKQGRIQLT
jgi:MFS family permease